MTLPDSINTARNAPARLIGGAVLHAPAAGSLGWGARLAVVMVASATLWAFILALAGLIA